MLHIWHKLLTFKMFDVAIYVFVSLFFFNLRKFQISMMQFDCRPFSPTCISQVVFFLSQRTFLYSKHHTYDKILWFTIFLFLFSRLRLQRRIIKKIDFGHFDLTTAILVSTSSLFVCFCVFFIHALLKKQNKNFAELNYCDFYFIVFPFDALENK